MRQIPRAEVLIARLTVSYPFFLGQEMEKLIIHHVLLQWKYACHTWKALSFSFAMNLMDVRPHLDKEK